MIDPNADFNRALEFWTYGTVSNRSSVQADCTVHIAHFEMALPARPMPNEQCPMSNEQ
jgi:hypothetical protein